MCLLNPDHRHSCPLLNRLSGVKDAKTVSPTQTLADLGMDSIMGAEVKQVLERNYDIVLSAQEIRGLTLGKLSSLAGGAPAGGDARKSREGTPTSKDGQVGGHL